MIIDFLMRVRYEQILGISVTEHVAGMAEEERRFAALFGDSASLRFRVR